MKVRLKVALLVGVALLTGVSAAVAAMNEPPAGFGANRFQGSGRGAGRFLADYDLNHDGKVSKDELNRALGQRFAAIAHGQPINAQQFANDAMRKHRDREALLFHRADWNGDGKLTLDEFMAPLRSRFAYADRQGTGISDCAHRARQAHFGDDQAAGKPRRYGRSSRGICFTSDLNQDGKVTHAEYDAANAKRFAEAAHGAKTLTFDQFQSIGGANFQQVGSRIFQHMDSNNDGKLTLAEYAAPQLKQFARFDRNHDGVVTRDEIASAPRSGGYRSGGGRYSAAR